jgi:hypothetical protein
MVIQGDFKVELVEANSKTPFKEHYHNGKTFVEVEPKVNFLIRRQRIETTLKEDFIIEAFVDGKDLGWGCEYIGVPKTDKTPFYDGVWVQSNGNDKVITHEHAFRFVKPKKYEMPQEANAGPILMGKVEYRIYKAHLTPQPYAGHISERFAGSKAKGAIIEGGMKPVLSEQAAT